MNTEPDTQSTTAFQIQALKLEMALRKMLQFASQRYGCDDPIIAEMEEVLEKYGVKSEGEARETQQRRIQNDSMA